jgi:hypothetical protein
LWRWNWQISPPLLSTKLESVIILPRTEITGDMNHVSGGIFFRIVKSGYEKGIFASYDHSIHCMKIIFTGMISPIVQNWASVFHPVVFRWQVAKSIILSFVSYLALLIADKNIQAACASLLISRRSTPNNVTYT